MNLPVIYVFLAISNVLFIPTTYSDQNLEESKMDWPNYIKEARNFAFKQCKEDLMWMKWNCHPNDFDRPELLDDTREAAYIYASTAATLFYAIVRNCTLGILPNCDCNYVTKTTLDPNCTSPLDYAQRVAREILDLNSDELTTADHNRNVGIEITKEFFSYICRCHGLSGSCTTKTCSKRVRPYYKISQKLKHLYTKALKIDFMLENNYVIGNTHIQVSKPTSNSKFHLIYSKESQNYCQANIKTGWPGMKGRLCSRKTGKNVPLDEKLSCRRLCRECGLHPRLRVQLMTKQCNCRFNWCCEVKCDICEEVVPYYVCT